MPNLTAVEVWTVLEKNLFAVLGMVTANLESRTVGIVYVVRDHKLYIGSDYDSWKVRHIIQNPYVSITVPITKRIPLLPWIKIPAATITFSGRAQIHATAEIDPSILKAIYRSTADDRELMQGLCIIEVEPEKDFLTYGVGVPLLTMRNPQQARGRVRVTP